MPCAVNIHEHVAPATHFNPVIGIILAGGQSSRMGSNKALLLYKNKPMIFHMMKILRASNMTSIYVSGQIEGYPGIADVITKLGPAGGIYSILNYFGPTKNRYLFLPVDMPLLPPFLLTRLLQASEQHPAVYFDGYYLPALLTDTPTLRHFLHSELIHTPSAHCSIKRILRAENATAIAIEDADLACFSNINTPLDLALANRTS